MKSRTARCFRARRRCDAAAIPEAEARETGKWLLREDVGERPERAGCLIHYYRSPQRE